jgi:hypothetical protein
MFKLRTFFIVLVVASMGCSGWYAYNFFFDTTLPTLLINGIESNCHYAGDIQCTVSCNKTGELSIWLDNQPLINKYKLNKHSQAHPFSIPTKAIANGKHQLKAMLIDTSFHQNKSSFDKTFFVDNTPLQAAFLRSEADYKVFQGRTLHIQFQVNKEIKDAVVHTLANSYRCFPESKNSLVYECFIPITCEENPNEYLFAIDVSDYAGNALKLENKFQVVMYPFKKQVITISPEKLKQEEELGNANHLFEKVVKDLTQQSIQEKLWRGSFCTPIDIIRTTCDFGTVRTTQHKGRYAHKALDIINEPKSVVWACQDGVVVLKDRFAGNGNTVIIDHGFGILSVYCHLDSFSKANVGDKIAKGSPIGTIGKTGYATGYHLHWEIRVDSMPVDPLQWTKPVF